MYIRTHKIWVDHVIEFIKPVTEPLDPPKVQQIKIPFNLTS